MEARATRTTSTPTPLASLATLPQGGRQVKTALPYTRSPFAAARVGLSDCAGGRRQMCWITSAAASARRNCRRSRVVGLAASPTGNPGGRRIPGAGRVDQLVDRERRRRRNTGGRHHHATVLAASPRLRTWRRCAVGRARRRKVGGLIETLELALIGEHDVDVPLRIRSRNSFRRGSDQHKTHRTTFAPPGGRPGWRSWPL